MRKCEMGDGLFEFEIECLQIAEHATPGQFVQVRPAESGNPLLRRPFSIAGVDGKNLLLLIKQVGQGTSLICRKECGEHLDVIGPLGQGFPVPCEDKKYLLVAGGYGIAPFIFFTARHRHAQGEILYGAKTKNEIKFFAGHFSDMTSSGWNVSCITEEKIDGKSGLVTDLLEKDLCIRSEYEAVYACGPVGMLRKVAQIAKNYNLPCLVSMESRMGCGFGVCLSCAVPIKTVGTPVYRLACCDGPVFRSEEINWEKL
ncbi:MAG: dihydroorotate dehydrogenase electron transfer subunit [bacterium]